MSPTRSPRRRLRKRARPPRAATGLGARPNPVSRRRFLSLVAAGSAAALLAPARRLAAATVQTARPPAAEPTPAMRAEIEKQKKSVAYALKEVRDYPLRAGSDMAFEFRPLRVR